ncbi:LuxS/MPP-like metallohydrolase [Pluteus cervinus]|uniref:LuxS/MPP-like metallohydrolase n=1 Tax=Pluteus cervinus TaxID=181527 RepID=A0ACD3B5L5_9AGAR|nr:LuxS/MPP-like metallohydrolase [Pluteus cervinus]
MLASRASTARNLKRVARSFATVVDSAGVKVAALDYNQPTSAVTVLVKAGSRFEPKPGVAHALKNFAFKSTTKRSALGTVRESELYGGVLSASLSREHLALTAEFLRGDEAFFVDLLSSFLTSAKFTRHEFEEYVLPIVESDSITAIADPATRAIELAHALAFRSGLGSSLFASPHNSLTVNDVKSFASSVFTKGNIAVLGTGISQESLSKLVEKSLGHAQPSASAASPASKYHGGETRVEGFGGPQTVFIGFGSSGAPSNELAALAAHLSPQPSVKWSQGLSPLSKSIPEGTSVQTVYLPYSDASLLGLLVQGQTVAGVKEAGKAAVQALKSAAAGGVQDSDLKKAIAKAKFTTASAVDSREGLVSLLGSKLLTGSDASLASALSSFDALTSATVSKSATALLNSKPTYITIGDIQELPHADELGL